ncbi:hypothetical protein SteCoe_15844 [Stentor coeruleus]|uniref:G-protein coupled receptors family 1 profile domain-containing protein n=1 Tax=Stentor coeruleus TaxID=5963 RepID=A0A1R2C2M8_9CILI|nr:hypothetical protein SteCoe_15844 [Stentor coeruleus]
MCFQLINSEITYYIQFGAGIFGIFGALSIIITYILVKQIRSYYFKLVFYVSIADVIRGLTFLIPKFLLKNRSICLATAAVSNYFAMFSALMALFLSVIIYQVTFKSIENVQKYHRRCLFLILFFLPIAYILPFITASYALIDLNCTFTEDFIGNMWRLGIFYIPGWTMIIISITAYCKVYKKLNFSFIDENTKKLLYKVALYPLVVCVLFILLTTLRIIEIFAYNFCTIEYLSMITMCASASQGFWNALIFFSTPSVRRILCKRNDYESTIKTSTIMSSQTSQASLNISDASNPLIKDCTSMQRF